MTTLEVWAPRAKQVEADVAGERLAMTSGTRPGWWQVSVPSVGHGADYTFRLDGGPGRPLDSDRLEEILRELPVALLVRADMQEGT